MPSARAKVRKAACPLAARLVTLGGGGASGAAGASSTSTAVTPSETHPTAPSTISQRCENSAGAFIRWLRRART